MCGCVAIRLRMCEETCAETKFDPMNSLGLHL